ncbi:MAG: hypothetical protein H6715_04680 [Myxococcales bacterium]|nr:hypothetical protein [Myxococcales bacterium]MCB9708420.1 hypothetical protein [Myxococcales bacterium]
MRSSGAIITGIVLAALSFATLPVAAQKRAPKPARSDGAISQAIKAYEAKEYADAALAFKAIADRKGQDAQRAEFFLAKSLYHLKFYQGALTIFDQIVQAGTSHGYFDQTLEWLAQLAAQLPESAGIIEKVGHYDSAKLEQFNTKENQDLYQHILYLMGRYKYSKGEFTEAVRLFSKVNASSKWFARAKLFEGISHVQERRARPAIAAFRAIVDTDEAGTLEAGDDEDRLVDLAWLSMARVYYKAANKVDPTTGERKIDGRILGNAVESWNKIAQGSEYWLDATFEASWAFFLADEYSRSLGNVHTLTSPYFEDAYYPEAYVLKAVVFFYNCQMDNASATVQKFHEIYDPVQGKLQTVLAQNQDNQKFYQFLTDVRSGNANLPPAIQGIVSSALSDRELLRYLEYIRMLDAEEKRLNDMPASFKNSPLGGQVLQDIALAKSFAIDQAGDLARTRYTRLIAELQDLMNQADTVHVEILSYVRGQLSQEMQSQQLEASRTGRGDVEVDEEHQMWPFNGEYWRDELGFYRQQVTSRCGR